MMLPTLQEIFGIAVVVVILVGVFFGEHLPKWDRHRTEAKT